MCIVQRFHESLLLVILSFFEVLSSLLLIVMMCSGHNMSGTMVRMMLLQKSAHLDPIRLKVKVMHICTFALSPPNQPTQPLLTASINHTFISFLTQTGNGIWGPLPKHKFKEILLRSSGPKKNPLILGKRSCNMDSDFHVFSLPLLTCLPWSTPHFHRQQTIMCGRNQRAE